jgi:hypothetical protein
MSIQVRTTGVSAKQTIGFVSVLLSNKKQQNSDRREYLNI